MSSVEEIDLSLSPPLYLTLTYCKYTLCYNTWVSQYNGVNEVTYIVNSINVVINHLMSIYTLIPL